MAALRKIKEFILPYICYKDCRIYTLAPRLFITLASRYPFHADPEDIQYRPHPNHHFKTTNWILKRRRCLTRKQSRTVLGNLLKSAAPQPRQVEVAEAEPATTSLIDVDSPHVSSVPPTYESQRVKTNTQAERIEREQEEKKRRDEAETGAKLDAARHAKGKAKAAKSKAVAAKSSLARNKSNPVVLGNALLIAVAGAGLGFGAYQKHAQGALTWRVVGVWSGAVGAVGVVDYFVSK
ncbi:hypothetical protein ACJ73_03519 [Blastomyces percursus]|uniref:Uncharacterized protein n=1 Tax=Blastomyces percursus TaxID=1658174 RepID=A0A1J9Q8L7_9EURO|nr:hypothetical protein ACJ73_03519 [Blastomyces percursus]